MSYAKRKKDYKRRKKSASDAINGNTYSMLRHDVFNSEEYFALSYSAKALLIDMVARYNRQNNGDIALSFENVMKERGWKSEATIRKATRELLEAKFVILTRQGGRNKTPNLYALTFYPINECLDKNGRKKINVSPTQKAPDYWKQVNTP